MNRVQSLDVLKGLVMVVMVIDHVRMYFHSGAYIFHPLDIEQTSISVFLTRYVTHICAPVFILLTGVSTYFISKRKPEKLDLSVWLLKRGLVIIILELTLINTAWFFDFKTDYFMLGVLWAIGFGLLGLSVLIFLPRYILLSLSLVLIVFHNMFDQFEEIEMSFSGIVWYFLHIEDELSLGAVTFYNGYPLIPSVAVLWLGYCLAPVFSWPAQKRIRFLGVAGIAMIFSFALIRAFSDFGDYWPWEEYPTYWQTILSFIDVHKTPHSLLFLMVMLGLAFLLLAAIELKGDIRLNKYLKIFGRVPMFYYIVHLYLIHSLAMLFAAVEPNYVASDMVIKAWISEDPQLEGFGYGLPVVYGVSIFVCILMYPISLWYGNYKLNNPQKWWTHYI